MVLPKPLVPLGDRPILDVIIRQLARHGFGEVILTVGYLAELIAAYVRHAEPGWPGVRARWSGSRRRWGRRGFGARSRGSTRPFWR